MTTQTLNVRIDKNVKNKAQKVAQELGLDLSSAIKIFLNKMILTKSIPFEIRTENGFTPKQEEMMIRESEYLKKHGKRYSSAKEMFEDVPS